MEENIILNQKNNLQKDGMNYGENKEYSSTYIKQ